MRVLDSMGYLRRRPHLLPSRSIWLVECLRVATTTMCWMLVMLEVVAWKGRSRGPRGRLMGSLDSLPQDLRRTSSEVLATSIRSCLYLHFSHIQTTLQVRQFGHLALPHQLRAPTGNRIHLHAPHGHNVPVFAVERRELAFVG